MKTTMTNCLLACLVASFALEGVAAESPESSVSRMESRTKDPTRDPGLFGDYWWANRFLSRSRLIEGFKGKTVDVVMLGDSITHFWPCRFFIKNTDVYKVSNGTFKRYISPITFSKLIISSLA